MFTIEIRPHFFMSLCVVTVLHDSPNRASFDAIIYKYGASLFLSGNKLLRCYGMRSCHIKIMPVVILFT
jgi:hypothetical protein